MQLSIQTPSIVTLSRDNTNSTSVFKTFAVVYPSPNFSRSFTWNLDIHAVITTAYLPWNAIRHSLETNGGKRPIGLWDVELPTFSTQSAHRWRWGLSALRAGRPLPPRRLSRPQSHNAAGRIRLIKKSSDLIRNQTRDLPACVIVLQPTTLPRAPTNVGIAP
jgi:hypothetical protein